MVALMLLSEAEQELDRLYDIDESAAALIDVLLEALQDDRELLEVLFRPRNHFTFTPPFELKTYAEMQKRGKNIFTVKIWNECGRLLPYRVLIGHHGQADTYIVLAVLHREVAYEVTDPLFQEIIDRYEHAGIPTYRRY